MTPFPSPRAAARGLASLAAIGISVSLFAQTPPTGATVRLQPFEVATRQDTLPADVGSAVDRIQPDPNRQSDRLADLLDIVPGGAPLPSGASGATTSLFLRGANSNQTLFLVDGIRLNDANTDYGVFLGGASLAPSDTVEIVRGPQSTLYGGEAIGGVVAIRSERLPGSGIRAGIEGGSFGTWRGNLSLHGESGPWSDQLSLAGGHTDNDRANNAFDDLSGFARVDRTLSSTVSIGTTARWFRGRYGDPGDRYTNDPDNHSREDNALVTVFADSQPAPEWTVRVLLGGQDRRFVQVDPSPGQPTDITEITNRRGVFDAQAAFDGFDSQRLLFGVTAERSHTRNTGFGDIDHRQSLLAFFAQDEFSPTSTVHLTAGLRSDDFDTFGRATTGRVTAAWDTVPRLVKLRASFGTGFRSPGFLDLYGQSAFYVGNPELRSEHARGWDAGVDLALPADRGQLGLTAFETRFTDLIIGDFSVFPSTVINADRARTRGLEAGLDLSPLLDWDLRLAYTYLEAENLSSGARLLRRPRHTASGDLTRNLPGGVTVGIGFLAVADRLDIDAVTFATIRAEDYATVRVHAAWQFLPSLAFRVRLENLLNERYEPVNGYPAPGFGAYIGVEYEK